MLLTFPIDFAALSRETMNAMKRFGTSHEKSLNANSVRRRIKYRATGWIEYDEFYPRLSKDIADEIDGILAKCYGFTTEELDFIVNFDIKYRMGQEEEAVDEE
jgi:hypothetical protein